MMFNTPPEAITDGQPFFVSRLYGETVELLHLAEDYFSEHGATDQEHASPVERMVYSAEMSRVTLRLSAVMTWLLARRAEHAGKISREEAAQRFRLAFHDACMRELPEMHHVLPVGMCDLLERSLELYQRTARLDEMIAETVH